MQPATRPSLQELLHAWREADRVWEQTDVTEEAAYRRASGAVLESWLAYQERVSDGRELLLIADDARRYVQVRGAALAVIGYEPSEMVGRRVDDVTAAEYGDRVDEMWDTFRIKDRMDGEFLLERKDGSRVPVVFQARYHFPIPGLHFSRIRLAG